MPAFLYGFYLGDGWCCYGFGNGDKKFVEQLRDTLLEYNIKGNIQKGAYSDYDYRLVIRDELSKKNFEDIIIKPYVNIVTMERKVPEIILETCCNRSED